MGLDDKAKNAGDKFVGRAKEWVGERADNPELADEGRAEQDKARLRQGGEHVKEAGKHVRDAVDEVRETFDR